MEYANIAKKGEAGVMTIKDLEQYRQLQNEVKQIAQRLEAMSKAPGGIVSDFVKGSSHDMRAKETVFTITGLDQRNRLKYERLQRILQARANRLSNDLLKIEEFIDTVTSSEIRRIIDYRYIQGFSWKAVSRRVYSYPSETRARMAITRYFAEI